MCVCVCVSAYAFFWPCFSQKQKINGCLAWYKASFCIRHCVELHECIKKLQDLQVSFLEIDADKKGCNSTINQMVSRASFLWQTKFISPQTSAAICVLWCNTAYTYGKTKKKQKTLNYNKQTKLRRDNIWLVVCFDISDDNFWHWNWFETDWVSRTNTTFKLWAHNLKFSENCTRAFCESFSTEKWGTKLEIILLQRVMESQQVGMRRDSPEGNVVLRK